MSDPTTDDVDDCPWHLAFWLRLKKRLLPFGDLTTWILLLITVVPLFMINRPMTITLGQWTAVAVSLAGVAVFLCRIMLPMIDLGALAQHILDEDASYQSKMPAAVAFAAVVVLLGVLFMGLVIWGKA